jgi:hypothetical protein
MSTAVVEEVQLSGDPEDESARPALKLVTIVEAETAADAESKAAWDLALDNRGLVGSVIRRMSAETRQPDYIKRDIIDLFDADALEALHSAALKYNQGDVRVRFSTYATKALQNAWHDTASAVLAQRGEAARPKPGPRARAEPRSSRVEKAPLPGEALKGWHPSFGRPQGTASKQSQQAAQAAREDTSWVTKRERQDKEISDMIRQAFGPVLRDTPNLTPREAEAVSFYLWGQRLGMARAFWKLDDFHSMTTLLLAQGQLLTRQQIAGLMAPSTWNGNKPHPVSRQNVNTWLTQAARKLGVSVPGSLRDKATDGLMAWEMRIKEMKKQGRY